MELILIAILKVLNVISFVIIIKCFMSWIPGGTDNKIYDMFCVLTDPIEEPIRSVLYKYINGPIDFTPIVAILLIRVAERVLIGMIY